MSVNADLLRIARELRINLSATLETALGEQVRGRQRERWLAENREAIAVYNRYVETHGVFSEGLRRF